MSKPKIVLNIGTPIVLPPDVLKKAQQIEKEWQHEKEQQKQGNTSTSHYKCIDR